MTGERSGASRPTAAAKSIASSLGLAVADAVVLQNSNTLTLRLLPCDVLARVSPARHQQISQLEVGIAQALAASSSPVAALAPRVEPRVYRRDGFVVTLWTYYKSVASGEIPPADYASALERLHAGMRTVAIPAPHFTDRVAEAQRLVASPERTPELAATDRQLLSGTLRDLSRAIGERGAPEQLLHGEPHPGNVLTTDHGPVFIDLETCCRGPVEFDLAHAPDSVSDHYRDINQDLLHECRILSLAIAATWRWDRYDQFPDGRRLGTKWLRHIRSALWSGS